MDLSFIVVNWNTRGSLLNCLASIRTSVSENLTHEIFVVDNASTDGSAEEVRRLYPDVNLTENSTNLGFAKASNQALRIARGRFLVLLNPDVRFLPGALNKLVDFITENQHVGMVGGQLTNRDGSRQNSFRAFPSLLTTFSPFWLPGKIRKISTPTKVDVLVGACMVVRAAALQNVGLLDEAFFLYFEEADWCQRLARDGWDIYWVPDAEIVHVQGRSVGQDKKNALVEYYRSRTLYFKKHKHRSQLLLLRAGVWINLFMHFGWVACVWAVTMGKVKEVGQRLSNLSYVLGWHLRGCPRWVGLANATVAPNVMEMRDGKALISACLITRNEAANVRDCLESLKFLDEIVVIDSDSDDGTPGICREYTDRVYQTDWLGFSATKNLCIEQAVHPWVLVIDADERVTPELRAEILDLKEPADGYQLPRQNYFLGKWIRHSGWSPDYTLRLFKKSAGKFGERAVHEAVDLNGIQGRLKNPLSHYTYKDVTSYITRLDRYSSLAAQQMLRDRTGDGLTPALRHVGLVLSAATHPPFTFLKMYVLQLGFLDGLHGFILAALHSFYVLAKYAKLWEMWRKPPAAPVSAPKPKASESVRV